jgi:hypothetical protein
MDCHELDHAAIELRYLHGSARVSNKHLTNQMPSSLDFGVRWARDARRHTEEGKEANLREDDLLLPVVAP